MKAMLGMYDRPETAPAHDRFWTRIHNALGYGPQQLTRDVDFWTLWTSPDLLLGQTCGLVYKTHLHGQVHLVGTPDYGLTDCPAGHVFGVYLARRDAVSTSLSDLSTGTFAYSAPWSQTGWASPALHFADLGLAPTTRLQTGGHYLSARAVAEQQADFTAVDFMTWELIRRYDDFAQDLQVIGRMPAVPSGPFITADPSAVPALQTALDAAVRDMSSEDQAILGLKGIAQLPVSEYLQLPIPPVPTQL